MANVKAEGNIRGKYKRYVDFTKDERQEVIDTVLECGDRCRAARIHRTTTTVVNLIFGGTQI